MAKITWLGEGDYKEGETPLSSCTWKGILFTAGDRVEISDEWMINKARGNRFFRVEEAAEAPAKKPEPEQSLPIGLIRPEMWTNTPPEDEPHKKRRGRPPRIRDNGDADR